MKHLIAACLLLVATASLGGCLTDEENDPADGCGLLSALDCGTDSDTPPPADTDEPPPGEGLLGIFVPLSSKK